MAQILEFIAGGVMPMVLVFIASAYLRREHASDVRAIWYVFSLTFVVSAVAIALGQASGAFSLWNSQGEPATTAGKLLLGMRDSMMDAKTDFAILATVLAVLLVPRGGLGNPDTTISGNSAS